MRRLGVAITGMDLPAVEKISESQAEDPFQISDCHAALGANAGRDDACRVDAPVQRARTPRTLAKLSRGRDREADLSGQLLPQQGAAREGLLRDARRRFGGHVPSTMEELVTLPGVGRKTANLVLILGFKSGQNICVDTHVHRISNRLGWVRTRQPEETGAGALSIDGIAGGGHCINRYLVTWGQNVCRPVYPRCGIAPSRRIVKKLACGGGDVMRA